ncbi:MAG: phage baseplate protein [Anaerolineae bacterium]|nr:phage baseplate protein [Anaerolineae bacterium]
MQPLTIFDILEIWEHGTGCSPVKQALVILSHAFPQRPAAEMVRLTIGQRDACLLQLRAMTFGPLLSGLVTCPACGERLEMAFDTSDLQATGAPFSESEISEAENIEMAFAYAPYEVTYHLPTSIDLSAIADPASACQRLLEACVRDVHRDGVAIPVSELPADALEALAEHISQSDPLVDVTLDVTCPVCQHAWQVIFDIVTFFWAEIDAWAARLMHEVHVLASAYGWREADILHMSVWRRQRYLELIGV